MANIQITQLPAGGPITGTEQVPVVQNGVTVRVPTSAIAASPAQQQNFLTLTQQPTLPNSRALSGSLGVGLTDGGALSTLTITLNGASGSLESAANGLVAKTGSSTVTNRSIAVSGSGLSVTNGSGASGDPTLALSGLPASLAGLSGTGILNMISGTSVGTTTILGTTDQITVVNGNGVGNPTISITDNPVLPGTAGVVVPSGDTASRAAVPTNGTIRYNTDLGLFEAYLNGAWSTIAAGSGVTSILTGTGLTGGPITSTGTISIDSTVVTLTGTQTLTNKSISGSTNTLTNIANASLTNSAITINGNSVSLGGSTTVTASTTSTLTIGTGLSGTSFNGSSPVTIAIDSTVATLTGTQTLTNKSISGSTNTLTNIPNNALTNSSVTIGSTAISLGGTSTTLAGLVSVTLTQDPVADLQAATKQYVDTLVASGIHFHQPVRVESPTNLNATYNQPGGAGNGVGATLTNAGTQAALVIDGVTLLVNDRVLIYTQTTQTQNGVYVVTDVGSVSTNWVLTRSADTNTYGLTSPNTLGEGSTFFVQQGTTGAGETYTCNTIGVIVFGTTNITFAQISSAQIYSAGTGLTLTGTTFSITNTAVTAGSYGLAASVPTIAINAQGQITSASDTAIAINGNQITSGTVGSAYITGSYTGITGVGTLTVGTWNADAVQALYGGTGLTSYTAGDLIYASGTSALSKLGLGTQGQVLVAGASAPTWGSIAGGTF
jgi:hypothetical protein